MPILTPDVNKVSPAYAQEIHGIPGTIIDATPFLGGAPLFTVPIGTVAARSDGGANFSKVGTIASYIGFGITRADKGVAVTAMRGGTAIAGFTGVEPEQEVYLDSTTNNTLTHTSAGNGKAIGHGLTPNVILFY